MSLLILQEIFQGSYLYPHFTEKNTEAQSGEVPCAKSHSVEEAGLTVQTWYIKTRLFFLPKP